jgi:hypothetical protein
VFELLTGFSSSQPDINKTLEYIMKAVIESRANSAEAAGGVRAVLKALEAENRDCPRLFTLVPLSSSVTHDVFELTLWCEHPGNEHPTLDAVYEIKRRKGWLVEVAPYLDIAAKALRVISAVAGVSGVPHQAFSDGVAKVKGMEKLISELGGGQSGAFGEELGPGGVTSAQGAGFRELFVLLHEIDSGHRWGDMRRFLTPEGDYLWICPEHRCNYDPGLPRLPN